MEKKVSEIYTEAYDDISKKWNDFMKSHYPKLKSANDKLQEALKSGNKDEIAEAKALYERTAKNITVNNRRFQSMSDDVAAKLSHTNEVALSYINNKMPTIYTKNYNAFGDEVIKGYSFSMTNENAVKALVRSNKILLPKKKIDIPKDMQWNKKMINSQVMQGIIQGESIPKLANRLMNVTDMDRASAIRNARTMTTAAENKGRQDSFEKAQSDGVIMKRRWVATNDDRTRAWHADLNGVEVDIDEPWQNDFGEIMYPGDPKADPCNVYNCRCSIRAIVKGFNWNKAKEEPELDQNGLTIDEQREIMSYKSSDYYAINETLRNDDFDALSDVQKEKVETLDAALEKLPTYSGDVSRSLQFSNEDDLNDFINNAQRDGKIESAAYMSTTKDIAEPYNSEGQVQILIKDTTTGHDLKDYDNGEHEVLFERDSTFYIKEQGWKDDAYNIVAADIPKDVLADIQEYVDGTGENFATYAEKETIKYVKEHMEQSDETFYRVEQARFTADNVDIGDTFKFKDNIRSFSSTEDAMYDILNQLEDMDPNHEYVIFETRDEVSHFPVDKYIGHNEYSEQHESLLDGRFEVTDKYYDEDDTLRIVIRQIRK